MKVPLDDFARLLGDEFEMLDVLGQGFIGTSIRVRSLRTGAILIAKVFAKKLIGPESALYLQHLVEIEATIPPGSVPHLLLPRGSGENDDYFFQLFDYLPRVSNLDQFARDPGLDLADKFRIIAHVASALAGLHQMNIIHGDVKPANVLIGDLGADSVWLSDFGMVRKQSDDAVLLFGTYAYLHPALRSGLKEWRSSSRRVATQATIGPYVDIFACGILALELLTGSREYPSVVSPETIRAHFTQLGLAFPSQTVLAAAPLISSMLNVGPGVPVISAREIHERATALALALGESQSNVQGSVYIDDIYITNLGDSIQRLEDIGARLEVASRPLLAVAGELRLLDTPGTEVELLNDLNEFFENALARTRTSWRVAVAITVTVFTIVVSMIVLAITLTVVTGKSHWAMIFGGIGVPALFAVFVWKPYDRIFRATMLSQTIELIQIQVVSGVRSTKDANERQRIFHEATEKMRVLLQDQIAAETTGSRSDKWSAPRRKATSRKKSDA